MGNTCDSCNCNKEPQYDIDILRLRHRPQRMRKDSYMRLDKVELVIMTDDEDNDSLDHYLSSREKN